MVYYTQVRKHDDDSSVVGSIYCEMTLEILRVL